MLVSPERTFCSSPRRQKSSRIFHELTREHLPGALRESSFRKRKTVILPTKRRSTEP